MPPLSWNDHVLTTLLCFNDILDPVLINGKKDSCERHKQHKARRELKKNCTASDGLLIEESTPTMECYRTLPCAFCEKIVIEIRRGRFWHVCKSCMFFFHKELYYYGKPSGS